MDVVMVGLGLVAGSPYFAFAWFEWKRLTNEPPEEQE